MKVLVTGAAGFVGSHLCEELLQRGNEVVGLDCLTDYYSVKFKQLTFDTLTNQGIKMVKVDLVKDSLQEITDGIDYVFHLAAQPGNSSKVSLETYVNNNIFASARLLESCLKSNISGLINISTSSVYGHFAQKSEEALPAPISNYGVTKLAAEQLILAQARDQKFPACSMRLYSVYGPRERPDKLYPIVIKALAEETEFPLFEGSDLHERSFTYVKDAVKGIATAIDHWDQTNGEIFNIGCDTAITTGEGIKICEEIFKKKVKIKKLPARSGDQKSTLAEIGKARKFLNYSPDTRPEQGLAETVEWYHNLKEKNLYTI